MSTRARDLSWKLYCHKQERLFQWGINKYCIAPYYFDKNLMERLRNIYCGGIPASILLLSSKLSNGKCYDRALLLAQALLEEEEEDVQLVYAIIDGIKLNPIYEDKTDSSYAVHCFVECVTKRGEHIIYDTSTMCIYDKELYWKMERPKVLRTMNKSAITASLIGEECNSLKSIEGYMYFASCILPKGDEDYESEPFAVALKREVELYKQKLSATCNVESFSNK